MAWMMVMGHCYTCHAPFSFNPDLVPALPASVTTTGEKEPVCKTCVEHSNPKRIANGLDPIAILPGAYEAVQVP